MSRIIRAVFCRWGSHRYSVHAFIQHLNGVGNVYLCHDCRHYFFEEWDPFDMKGSEVPRQ